MLNKNPQGHSPFCAIKIKKINKDDADIVQLSIICKRLEVIGRYLLFNHYNLYVVGAFLMIIIATNYVEHINADGHFIDQ